MQPQVVNHKWEGTSLHSSTWTSPGKQQQLNTNKRKTFQLSALHLLFPLPRFYMGLLYCTQTSTNMPPLHGGFPWPPYLPCTSSLHHPQSLCPILFFYDTCAFLTLYLCIYCLPLPFHEIKTLYSKLYDQYLEQSLAHSRCSRTTSLMKEQRNGTGCSRYFEQRSPEIVSREQEAW